jgi:hypothetical protein
MLRLCHWYTVCPRSSIWNAICISQPFNPNLSTSSSSLPPPPTRTSTHDIRPTRLQMLQYLGRIIAIHTKRLVPTRTHTLSCARRASSTNLLDHVPRVCGAYDRDLAREPLLKRLGREEAVGREPAGQGRADVDFLRERRVGGREGDVAFVDGDVFFGVGGYADLYAVSVIGINAASPCCRIVVEEVAVEV